MVKRICEISNRILRCASSGLTRLDFIRNVAATFLDFSSANNIIILLGDPDRLNSFEFKLPDDFTIKPILHSNFPVEYFSDSMIIKDYVDDFSSWVEEFFNCYILKSKKNSPLIKLQTIQTDDAVCFYNLNIDNQYRSYYIIPFVFDEQNYAFLIIKATESLAFTKADLSFFSKLVQVLSDGFSHQFAQDALKERVKELTCLYQITQIANRPNYTISQIMQRIVEIIPYAMQYPEIAYAKIFIDDDYYHSRNFQESKIRLSSVISSKYEQRGILEVFYTEKELPKYCKIFLPEEENLIETISKQLALIIERKQIEIINNKLQEQLRHADRLATIGQLSAGIAHEMNEPLGTILGFAQLIEQNVDTSSETFSDIRRIVNAALHGREVVRKLLLFSRQMPPKKGKIDINHIIENGLYFLESRSAKSGIEIIRKLDPNLPNIDADTNQIHQVLVNLIVNAIHSMPEGGLLTLSTKINNDGTISIFVKDTGIGIPEEIQQKIFIPFFTTKDIDQGTGLGLPVVHGIVTSHHGRIIVKSKVNAGSIFEVRLPYTQSQS